MHQTPYNPSEIEVRVQARWDANKTYEVTEDPSLEKFYCLSMLFLCFPMVRAPEFQVCIDNDASSYAVTQHVTHDRTQNVASENAVCHC